MTLRYIMLISVFIIILGRGDLSAVYAGDYGYDRDFDKPQSNIIYTCSSYDSEGKLVTSGDDSLKNPYGDMAEGYVVCLVYHHVAEISNRSTIMPVKTLADHIIHLKESGYQIISTDMLEKWLDGEIEIAKGVVISFDDGYSSFYNQVYPLLVRYGVCATCFLITAYSEDDRACDYNHITFDMARIMNEKKVAEFGSHSHNGHYYVGTEKGNRPILSEKLIGEGAQQYYLRVFEDLEKSKSSIETMLGSTCKFFSYPYGWVTPSLKKAVEETGFDLAFTIKSGVITHKTDRYELPRVIVGPDISGKELIFMLDRIAEESMSLE